MKWLAGASIFAASLAWSCASGDRDFPFSGTVQAESAAVGSTVGGRVTAVLTQDGAVVARGAALVRFDDRQYRAAYDAATSQADQARAALADLVAGPRPGDVAKAAAAAAQAEAEYRSAALREPEQTTAAVQAVREAQADLAAARAGAVRAIRDDRRTQSLFAQGAVSAQAADASAATARSARSAVTSAAARLRTARSALSDVASGSTAQDVSAASEAASAAEAELALVRSGSRPDQIAQARAALQAAESNATAAKAKLDECTVLSPARGVVNGFDLHAGDLVAAGAAVATIDEYADPWVRIYVAQSDLGKFSVGAAVRVRSDAERSAVLDGRIEAIDTSAQFTPRDVETSSDRADLAFGVKVRIHDPDHRLRPGTTVDVSSP